MSYLMRKSGTKTWAPMFQLVVTVGGPVCRSAVFEYLSGLASLEQGGPDKGCVIDSTRTSVLVQSTSRSMKT